MWIQRERATAKRVQLLLIGVFSSFSILIPDFCDASSSSEGFPGHSALSASGGIAIPSFGTAAFENPSGLVETPHFTFLAQGGADSAFKNFNVSGGLQYGTQGFGIGGGVTDFFGNTVSSSQAYFGLAAGLASNKVSVGVSGATGISPSGGTVIHAGVRLGRPFVVGLTGHAINTTTPEWGAGIGIPIGSSASLVVDSTANSGLKVFNFQPGLIVGNETVAGTLSYGFGGGGSTQLSSGISAGGSVRFKNGLAWQVYYNRLAMVYTVISISI